MCGIVGFAGTRQAAPVLLEGLERLEYRGYDSSGIAVAGEDGLMIARAAGRLRVLKERTAGGDQLPGCTGIGHTRWATHGAPTDANAHPHLSASGKIAVVHNGIIENHVALREELEAKGILFSSETDTEAAAHLIGMYYESSGDFLWAVRQAVQRLRGSFALAVLCGDEPGTIIAVKKESPLVFGFGSEGNFIASDVPAILKHTRNIVYLNDGDMVAFEAQQVRFFDSDGRQIAKNTETIPWELACAERGGYAHFMLKEIFDQPKALFDTIHPRLQGGMVVLEGVELPRDYLCGLRRICMVACGSARYVALLGKEMLERYCRIPVEVAAGSEFRYAVPAVDGRDLVIVISQSGETADTLSALREAKRRGAMTLAIVNVVGSAIAKAADQVLHTWAGPEIAVATTKAFSAQLAALELLTLCIGKEMGTVSPDEYYAMAKALTGLPGDVQKVLDLWKNGEMGAFAARYCSGRPVFYIGRNWDSALCLEGSLKLKEVAYLPSFAYPAGELKHGPIALIEDGTPVIALATNEALFEKTLSNIREVKTRGARVLCVTLDTLAEEAVKAADDAVAVPMVHPFIQPHLSLLPLQLLAYEAAVQHGCDVDKPRNLAKSVTVE